MPEGEAILNTREGEGVALLGVSANGRLSGMTFECAVEQRYRNDTSRNLEVVYTFPLPPAAVLLGVELCIGDRRLAGVVMPKAQAERTYEDAIEKGDLPVMIERSAHGLFTANVGNLQSGEEAVIRYRWAQLLRFEQAGIRVAIPTTIAPRYGDPVKDGGLGLHESADASLSAAYPFSLSIEIVGELAAGRVLSPTHAIDLRRTETALVVGLARSGFLDRDFVLCIDDLRLWTNATLGRDGDAYLALATFIVGDSDGQLADDRSGQHETDGVELKILVDCSGSMAGDSIAAAKRGLQRLMATLRPADHFTLSRFGTRVVHEVSSLEVCHAVAIRSLDKVIAALDANLGGTEIVPALESVFALNAPSEGADVLLITDGEVWATESLVAAARRSGHRIFAIGVGSAPAESLLRRLADETGGACELVTPNEDIATAIVRMYQKIASPRLRNAAIAWPQTPQWTTPLPRSAFPGETLHVFAAFAQPPRGRASLTATSGHGVVAVSCELLQQVEGPTALDRIAAAERIKSSTPEDALQLALHYQLVTDQTNLVAVHERADGVLLTELPYLQNVPQMLAAGWGATSSVRHLSVRRYALACDDFDDSVASASTPPVFARHTAVMRRRVTAGSGTLDKMLPSILVHDTAPISPSQLAALINSHIRQPSQVMPFIVDLGQGTLPRELADLVAVLATTNARDDVLVAMLSVIAEWSLVNRHVRRAIRALVGHRNAELEPLMQRLSQALAGTTEDAWRINGVTHGLPDRMGSPAF